jgi:hypothetical protein
MTATVAAALRASLDLPPEVVEERSAVIALALAKAARFRRTAQNPNLPAADRLTFQTVAAAFSNFAREVAARDPSLEARP